MITKDDLIHRFGIDEMVNLTDKDHYQAINDTVMGYAIADASALVASYLKPAGLITETPTGSLVYTVNGAVQPTPKALSLKLCDIARYYLYENGTTEIVEKRYSEAIDWLKMVAAKPQMLTGLTPKTNSSICVIAATPPSLYGIGLYGTDKPDWDM